MLLTALLVLVFAYILLDALISGKVLSRAGHTYSKHSHPKTYWFLVLVAWVCFGVLALALLFEVLAYHRSVKDMALVATYEQTFPALIADHVRSYVDKDWCKYIDYDGHVAYFVDQPNSACSASYGNKSGYSQADSVEFQKVEKLFDNKVAQMGIVSDATGKVTSASFSPNNCFWCDTSYDYVASGTPELSDGFNLGKKINDHWYTIIEDWP